jgi:hypothetical protein
MESASEVGWPPLILDIPCHFHGLSFQVTRPSGGTSTLSRAILDLLPLYSSEGVSDRVVNPYQWEIVAWLISANSLHPPKKTEKPRSSQDSILQQFQIHLDSTCR